MKKNELNINVVGATNVGKSTVSYIILNALMENGIDVNLSPEILEDYGSKEKFYLHMKAFLKDHVNSINEKTKINLNEIQLLRV